MEKNIALAGILLGIKPIDLPIELRNFLTSDGMDGIKDLEFMLKDPKLTKRIPPNVRYQYEIIYSSLSIEIDQHLDDLEKAIKDIRSNPKDVIHETIQKSLKK